MKKVILILSLSALLTHACHTIHAISKSQAAVKIPEKPVKSDTLQLVKSDGNRYDLIVLDPSYETYLKSIARPDWYHSNSFYKTQNLFYVAEWNRRHEDPMHYDPDFYSTYIDYRPDIEYGLKLNYKLYNYFQFIRYRYGIQLR